MPEAPDILGLRLARHLIEPPAEEVPRDPAGVIARMGAMQAQDYRGALWAVGLRAARGTTDSDIERAIAERRIVRTWPMRGTLHLVAPGDVRWMLALLSERVLARATKRHADLGLTEETFERARILFTDALAGGKILTRAEMMSTLSAGGIDPADQRGYHVLWVLALRGVLCCGPIEGKQQTFVLLDEWVPREGDRALERTEALALLASRYFDGHGPATLADFAWRAGVTKTDARVGMEAIGTTLEHVGDTGYLVPRGAQDTARASGVHLLPGFDEYFLGYMDRSLALGKYRETYGSSVSANGMFAPTIVANGRVVGTWRRTLKRDRVEISVRAFRELTPAERRGLAAAAERYGEFLGLMARVKK